MEKKYLLTLVFNTGQVQELMLDQPHQLAPNQQQPYALIYVDRDGLIHNIPWTSLKEFYFSPDEYLACRNAFVEKKKGDQIV